MIIKDREKVVRYIKTALGSPVCVVEVTDEQIGDCINMAEEWVLGDEFSDLDPESRERMARRYASAMTKLVLGRIRSKYGSVPIPGGEICLDGRNLIEDASTEFLHLGTGPFG